MFLLYRYLFCRFDCKIWAGCDDDELFLMFLLLLLLLFVEDFVLREERVEVDMLSECSDSCEEECLLELLSEWLSSDERFEDERFDCETFRSLKFVDPPNMDESEFMLVWYRMSI